MLIPSDHSATSNFNVEHGTVRRILLSLIFSVLILAAIGTYLFLKPDYKQRSVALQKENLKLENDLVTFQTKLAILENTVERIEHFDRKLRVMTNYVDHRRKIAIGPLDEGEMALSQMDGFSRTNEALAIKLKEKLGELDSSDLSKEVDRLLSVSSEREKELAELSNFLEDQKLMLSHIPSIWPAEGWVTSGFGYRSSPFTSSKKFHHGMDIANNIGTPIHSPADGIVIYTGSRDGYGRTLVINHGFGLTTRYAHCSEFKVKVGKRVKRGDLVATVGNTGRSTGPHLHYEVRLNNIPQNPRRYILE